MLFGKLKNNKGTSHKSKKGYFPFFVVFIMLLCFYPYEFYSAYLMTPTNLSSSLYIGMSIILVLLTLFLYHKVPNIPSSFIVVVSIQSIGYVIYCYVKGEPFPVGYFFPSVLSVIMIVFLSSSCGLFSFYKKYNKWILIMAILGTAALVLVWAGVLQPLMPFVDISDDDIMYNYGITFSVFDDYTSFQYCGFFDEPGAMASWGMYALLFNKLFIKDNRLEIILIITLIATMSLGFYIQLFAYLLLFVVFKKNNGGNMGRIVLLIGIVVIISVFYSFEGTKYDSIYQETVGRIETTLDESKCGGLAVGNRESLTLAAQNEFLDNPLLGTSKKNLELGNNLYEPLARYGIVGTFFLYLPFWFLFFLSFKKKDFDLLKCVIIMFLGFTHRPFHINLLSFFVIYSFIVLYYQQRRYGQTFLIHS